MLSHDPNENSDYLDAAKYPERWSAAIHKTIFMQTSSATSPTAFHLSKTGRASLEDDNIAGIAARADTFAAAIDLSMALPNAGIPGYVYVSVVAG